MFMHEGNETIASNVLVSWNSQCGCEGSLCDKFCHSTLEINKSYDKNEK